MFSSNQLGNFPTRLLWERSITRKSYWYWRNLGVVPLSPLNEPLNKLRNFNWKVGIDIWVLGSKSIALLSVNRTLRFERLENKENLIGFRKSLSDKERYSSDVKLDKWGRSLKWLSERSNRESDVKFAIQEGSFPSKLLPLRPISLSFRSSH